MFIKKFKENHRTKQMLCLVSRTWRVVAQELIFEYIFLNNDYDWSKLADGFEESRRVDIGRGRHGAGWYVKRIEINTKYWTEELGCAAARVIRCCPNMRVLTVGADEEKYGGVPVDVIMAVFQTCPRAIRSLDWTCDLGPATMTTLFGLISIASKLESLFLFVQQNIHVAHVERLKAAGQVSLPELHTLELVSTDFDPSIVLTLISLWNLPRLRQVVLCGQCDLDHAFRFFEAHGSKLHSLEFDYAGEPEPDLVAESQLHTPGPHEIPQKGPAMVLLMCPNLRELVLHTHWAAFQAQPGHPNVERIGLRGLHLLASSSQPRRVGAVVLRPQLDEEQRAALHALKLAFPILINRNLYPKVTAIRLLDFDQSRFRSVPWRAGRVAFWAFWVTRFERIGVRLEDHAGNLVQLVFREVNVFLPEDEKLMARGYTDQMDSGNA